MQDNGSQVGGSQQVQHPQRARRRSWGCILEAEFLLPQEAPVYVLKASNRLDDPSHTQHQGSSALLRMNWDGSRWPHLHNAFPETTGLGLYWKLCTIAQPSGRTQVTTAAHLAISAKVVFPETTSLNDGRLSLTPACHSIRTLFTFFN